MEDVLDVSHRPAGSARPVVCLDETNRQVLGETRAPLPPTGEHPARYDPEYVCGGIATLFLVTDPLRGWRAVMVSMKRTRLDVAACSKELVDVHDPQAERIVLVLDQLNIHPPPRWMPPSRLLKPNAWPTNWRSTTRRSMGPG
jgi:hypothetical protein